MDITLTLNGRDFSSRVDKYAVQKLIEEVRTVTMLNGTEYAVQRIRDAVVFALIPYDEETATADYNALKALEFVATYTDPNTGNSTTRTLRVVSDLESVFGIKSINGKRYYKGGEISLRAKEVNS